jgi:PAS domain S-box-containing protein
MTPDGIILSWNSAAQRLYGYTALEAIGRSIYDLYPADQLLQAQQGMGRVKGGERLGPYDTVRRRKDGTRVDVTLTRAPIFGRSGRVVGEVSFSHDITPVKRLEEQLRQSQKMKVIGVLAGGLAHDFNNLATIIGGYSNLLISQLEPADPMREPLLEIEKAAERAGMITRPLLDLGRQHVPETKVVDINSIVLDVEKMLRHLIGDNIVLTTVLAPGLSPVKADPVQLQQVLINLAVNSRDAMSQGGRMTIETRNVHLDEDDGIAHVEVQPGDFVMLAVSDDGCGMDDATTARIFEPFFTTKGPGVGTGLGMTVVDSIVRQRGGHIQVISALGKGTTIKVLLPKTEEQVQKSDAMPEPRTLERGNETLLIVEDNVAVREVVRSVLRSCGYTVLDASDGNEAERVAQDWDYRIDLLLSDMVMPHLTGNQLAERLEDLNPKTKILLMSGYAHPAVPDHGRQYPFIKKPFTPSELARKVREVLDAGK